jgi:hypothetical protein
MPSVKANELVMPLNIARIFLPGLLNDNLATHNPLLA